MFCQKYLLGILLYHSLWYHLGHAYMCLIGPPFYHAHRDEQMGCHDTFKDEVQVLALTCQVYPKLLQPLLMSPPSSFSEVYLLSTHFCFCAMSHSSLALHPSGLMILCVSTTSSLLTMELLVICFVALRHNPCH